eukprot:scaffold341024_cov19-Prasinocladus_malaysianus.AAC.1
MLSMRTDTLGTFLTIPTGPLNLQRLPNKCDPPVRSALTRGLMVTCLWRALSVMIDKRHEFAAK